MKAPIQPKEGPQKLSKTGKPIKTRDQPGHLHISKTRPEVYRSTTVKLEYVITNKLRNSVSNKLD